MATAGDVYNDNNASDRIKALSPSKLAELSKVDRRKVEDDLKAGRITATTTQKDLREYAKAAIQGGEKPEVIDSYSAIPYYADSIFSKEDKDKINKFTMTMDEWDSLISKMLHAAAPAEVEVIKLPKGAPTVNGNKSSKKTIERRLYIAGDIAIAFMFHKQVPKKPAIDIIKTKEDAIRLLSAMDPAALEEVMSKLSQKGGK